MVLRVVIFTVQIMSAEFLQSSKHVPLIEEVFSVPGIEAMILNHTKCLQRQTQAVNFASSPGPSCSMIPLGK